MAGISELWGVSWEQWPYGSVAQERWERLRAQERLPAALLWVGPEGIGKTPLALQVAASLFGQGKETPVPTLSYPHLWLAVPKPSSMPIEEAVNRFREALRADLLLSLAEWENLLGTKGSLSIGVEVARHLQSFLSLSVPSGSWRVIIFWHAELLTRQAANALLKLVEEPPANVLFLFLATRAEALPATLRSRCQVWRFPPLNDEALRALAGQELPIATLRMARGSYARLRRLLSPEQTPYIQALRSWLRAIWASTPPADLSETLELLAQAPQLSELLLMGTQLILDHPQLNLAQKALGVDTLLSLADEIEAHLSPSLLLWEATVRLQKGWQAPSFPLEWLHS